MVIEAVGPGRNREWMLTAVISGSNESLDTLFNVVRGIQFSDDLDACLTGLTGYIAKTNASLPQLLAHSPYTQRELSSIVAGLATRPFSAPEDHSDYLSQLSGRTELVRALLAQGGGSGETQKILGDYFRNLSFCAPQGTLAIAMKELGPFDGNNRSVYDWILGEAFRNDPRQAIEEIEKSLTGMRADGSGPLVEAAIKKWMK